MKSWNGASQEPFILVEFSDNLHI